MAKQRSLNELRQEKNYGYKPPVKEEKQRGYSDIDIETTKAVCDEMEKYEVFQAETYFTPQGEEWFEDEWFEFYHEHHGDILGDIMKSFTN
jgi:hypothetical protein